MRCCIQTTSCYSHAHFLLFAASHVSQFPSLNFLVYVPKRTEYPLFIRSGSSGSEQVTDNFLVPQWGGVVIYNPDELLEPTTKEGGDQARSPIHVRVAVERLMPVFVGQLQMLLGVPEIVRGMCLCVQSFH